jgi:hypothetical protein
MIFPTAVVPMSFHYYCRGCQADALSHLHSPLLPRPIVVAVVVVVAAAFYDFEYVDFSVFLQNWPRMMMMTPFHEMDCGANEALPLLRCKKGN